MLRVSVPGKLFLTGEYAVLEGAPALLSAVNRRVQVSIEQAPGHCWIISAPDIGIDTLELARDGRLPGNLDAATRARLGVYDAVRATMAEYTGPLRQPLAIRIDSKAFHNDGHKLGLGSSAAVAAALTAALSRISGEAYDKATLCRLTIAAHRHAQKGAGSGADVATSVYGGIIEYCSDTVQAQRTWPDGITGMAVVTGDGASTTDLVGRVAAYSKHEPGAYQADMAQLKRLATMAKSTLTNAASFLSLVQDYFAALDTLGNHAGAGIVVDRHRELASLAARHGGAFKTTGAGGGDLGLVFARSGKPARKLTEILEANGVDIIPLDFGADGLAYD